MKRFAWAIRAPNRTYCASRSQGRPSSRPVGRCGRAPLLSGLLATVLLGALSGCALWAIFASGKAVATAAAQKAAKKATVRIASKPFGESYILAEMLAQLVEDAQEATAERKFGLGGPNLVVEALRSGNIDVDVNYTGSLAHLFLPNQKNVSVEELQAALVAQGLTLSASLGFNNTYAIAVRTKTATELGLRNISDLRRHANLRGAFTPDFLNYDDGFYKLQEFYGVKLASVRPMQHSLAYQALKNQQIDVTDAYTTDGTLSQFDLTLLIDDENFFPKYYGVITARLELPARLPRTWAAMRRLEGQISDAQMVHLNAQVDTKQLSIEAAARAFLWEHHLLKSAEAMKAHGTFGPDAKRVSKWEVLDGLWLSTWEHLLLVLLSLLLSCLVGVPIGILAFYHRRIGHVLLAITGLLQTIPSLALLCFLIPIFGIGAVPTICALFIYGLLPIVESTTSGLLALDSKLLETAKILGLSRWQRLRLIELPLASLNIMAGIKTSAIINVATATIAALIGAGGYGRYITSGLAMNDLSLMLKGAIPTALMAVFFHALFVLLHRLLVPQGLRS